MAIVAVARGSGGSTNGCEAGGLGAGILTQMYGLRSTMMRYVYTEDVGLARSCLRHSCYHKVYKIDHMINTRGEDEGLRKHVVASMLRSDCNSRCRLTC